jgi:hypothetical protein
MSLGGRYGGRPPKMAVIIDGPKDNGLFDTEDQDQVHPGDLRDYDLFDAAGQDQTHPGGLMGYDLVQDQAHPGDLMDYDLVDAAEREPSHGSNSAGLPTPSPAPPTQEEGVRASDTSVGGGRGRDGLFDAEDQGFRMSAEMYLVWSARHLQDDDPAAEGTPPGWARVCASCGEGWQGGGHAFCCPRVNPPLQPSSEREPSHGSNSAEGREDTPELGDAADSQRQRVSASRSAAAALIGTELDRGRLPTRYLGRAGCLEGPPS